MRTLRREAATARVHMAVHTYTPCCQAEIRQTTLGEGVSISPSSWHTVIDPVVRFSVCYLVVAAVEQRVSLHTCGSRPSWGRHPASR